MEGSDCYMVKDASAWSKRLGLGLGLNKWREMLVLRDDGDNSSFFISLLFISIFISNLISNFISLW